MKRKYSMNGKYVLAMWCGITASPTVLALYRSRFGENEKQGRSRRALGVNRKQGLRDKSTTADLVKAQNKRIGLFPFDFEQNRHLALPLQLTRKLHVDLVKTGKLQLIADV
jgi:hypothetical protein